MSETKLTGFVYDISDKAPLKDIVVELYANKFSSTAPLATAISGVATIDMITKIRTIRLGIGALFLTNNNDS